MLELEQYSDFEGIGGAFKGLFGGIWKGVKTVGSTTYNITKTVARDIDKIFGSKTMQTVLQAGTVVLPTIAQIQTIKAASKRPSIPRHQYVSNYAQRTVKTTQQAGTPQVVNQYPEYFEPFYSQEQIAKAQVTPRVIYVKGEEEVFKKYLPYIIGGGSLILVLLLLLRSE